MPLAITGEMYDLFCSASRMAVVSSDAAESFSKYPEALRRNASTA